MPELSKPRGRPKSMTAKSNAQRRRDHREKLKLKRTVAVDCAGLLSAFGELSDGEVLLVGKLLNDMRNPRPEYS